MKTLFATLQFMNDLESYYVEDDYAKEDMYRITLGSNSPWSQTDFTWEVSTNTKDSYTEKDPSTPDYKCIYTVVGYDAITTEIYGYGQSPQEALQDCINLFDRLQKEYNPNGDAF